MRRARMLVIVLGAVAGFATGMAPAVAKTMAKGQPQGGPATATTVPAPNVEPVAKGKTSPAKQTVAPPTEQASTAAHNDRRPAPPNARVYFISPHDGDTVTNPFVVRFGLVGMGVSPSGVGIPGTGHFNLLIDVTNPPNPDDPVPMDAHHLDFDRGQIQTYLSLTPGQHTLQLLVSDGRGIPQDPIVISRVITINVKKSEPKPEPRPAAASSVAPAAPASVSLPAANTSVAPSE